jgi:hypothetical protein
MYTQVFPAIDIIFSHSLAALIPPPLLFFSSIITTMILISRLSSWLRCAGEILQEALELLVQPRKKGRCSTRGGQKFMQCAAPAGTLRNWPVTS